jgi:hypothetical protein
MDNVENQRIRQKQFQDARNELSQMVRELVVQLEELQHNLPVSSSQTRLAERQQELIAIAIEFVNLKTNRHHPLYAFAQRSEERLAAIDQVIDYAHQAARLFEELAQEQASYHQVTAQLTIATLIAALRSLDPEAV